MPPSPRADVVISSGSISDAHLVAKVTKVLDEHKVPYEHHVISAHRNPEELDAFLKKSDAKIFIAVAGMSAALPGVIASKTDKPVIGVPVSGKLGGFDSLLSIAQMPKGVPVACVAVDGGENAALLAIRILKLIKSG